MLEDLKKMMASNLDLTRQVGNLQIELVLAQKEALLALKEALLAQGSGIPSAIGCVVCPC